MTGVPAPSPSVAWDVVLTLGVLANLCVTLVTLVRSGRVERREIIPDPLRVRAVEDGVTRDQHDRDVAALRTNIEELRAGQERLHTQLSDGLRRVHERIDRLPPEIIAILRNTGALG